MCNFLVAYCVSRMKGTEVPLQISIVGNKVEELKNKRLNDADVFCITETIGHFLESPFVALDLSNNSISDSGAHAIMILLAKSNTIVDLNLSGNNIGVNGAEKLARAIAQSKYLAKLNLKSNPLTDAGVSVIAGALATNHSLVELNISDTNMGIAGLCDITVHVSTHASLSRLYIDNVLTTSLQGELANMLANMLKRNSGLHELSFGKMGFHDDGIENLILALKRNNSVTYLSLRCNLFGPDALEHISEWLEDPECICFSLDLSGNRIFSGIRRLAQALYRNTHLRILNLASCNLNDQGLSSLAESLRHNYSIRKLYLRGNKFGPKSAKLFLPILKNYEECDFLDLLGVEDNSGNA